MLNRMEKAVNEVVFHRRQRSHARLYAVMALVSLAMLLLYWSRVERPVETIRYVQHQVTFEGRIPFLPEEDPLRLYGDRIQAQLDRELPKDPQSVLIYEQPEEEASQHLWMLDNCPVKCTMTNMDSMMHAASAMIFTPDFIDRMPLERPPGQLWFLNLLESPLNTPTLVDFNGKINYTVSYRLDADFVSPYGRYIPHPPSTPKPSAGEELLTSDTDVSWSSKSGEVAWFVSHCLTSNHRWQYAKQLQKFIDVRIFGECGDGRRPQEEMGIVLKHDYKFYLAFENSNCDDYITEKFFDNALKNDVIPIVMGAPKDDYQRVAPPNSFIHVSDFEDAEHLAKYLHFLSHNEQEFRKYFDWKKKGRIGDSSMACRICLFMQKPIQKEYIDIETWWHGRNDCMYKSELPGFIQ